MDTYQLPLAATGEGTREDGRWHRPLLILAAVATLVAVGSAVGVVVDDRTVLGVPVWLKPFKFALSFVLYASTLAWLLRTSPRGRRLGWWLGTLVVGSSLAEFGALLVQVVRGRASHFNVATPFDAAVFDVMGITVAVLWLATFGLALVVSVQRHADRATALAVRFGLGLSLAGMLVGVLMLGPTPEQQRALDRGLTPTTLGGHSVGVPDGGPSMPITGWSTTGGDLRIPHFFGIHALQVLPMMALLLGFLARRWPAGPLAAAVRARLVWVAATGYTGGLALLVWQAERGQPLTRPDPVTLFAAGALAVAVLVATVGMLARHRPVPAGPR